MDVGTAPDAGPTAPAKECGAAQVVFPGEGQQQGQTAEAVTLENGQDLVLGAPRTSRRPLGRSMVGLHSPILPDPPAKRMTGPPDGYADPAFVDKVFWTLMQIEGARGAQVITAPRRT